MNARQINEILGINESFKLPERLMGILLTDPEKIFDEFMAIGEPLDHDWFTEYFEEEHSNKTKMAQDFTPKEVCELLSHVTGKAEIIADICAGTGGLTIGMWVKNPEAFFVCYEYSERAIPILCFNLAIRNIPAFVKRCDILTGEIETKYATIIPKGKIWPEYFKIALEQSVQKFLTRYKSTINIQMGDFQFFEIDIHPDEKTQHEIAEILKQCDRAEGAESKIIETLKDCKRIALSKMMC